MKQLKYILFGTALSLSSFQLVGQNYPVCGIGGGHSHKLREATNDKSFTPVNQNQNARKADFSGTKYRFKVKAHGFRKPATSNTSVDMTNISEDEVLEYIEDLNKAYDPVNFEFVLCEMNYIDVSDHNLTFKIDYNRGADEIKYCDPNDEPGHINIYFPNNVSDGERELAGRADFPEYDRLFNDLPLGYRIIVGSSSIGATQTLIHEMGHFFNLYHTSETIHGLEKANGSNCSTTGDLLCDTPADPYPSGDALYFSNNCYYTGPIADPWGTGYAPLTDNYMSLNPQLCRKKFTDQQIYRMHNHGLVDRSDILIPYQSSFDYDIKNNKFYPPFAEVSVHTVASSILTSTSVISESSDIKYYADEKIVLEKGFTVKKGSNFRAKRVDFCDMPQRASGVILLNPMRLAEFNEASETESTLAFNEAEKVAVFPNPNNGSCSITYHAEYAGNVTINIYDMYGKKLHSLINVAMNVGHQSVDLELYDYPAGIYSAVVESGGKIFSTQFIITR